jgi:hypothetical protein
MAMAIVRSELKGFAKFNPATLCCADGCSTENCQTDRSCITNRRKRGAVGTDTCGSKPRQFRDRVDAGNLDSKLTQVLRRRATICGNCVVDIP